MPTFDCDPTMTDKQVLEFCRNGYLILEGVVPDEINKRTLKYCDENGHPPGAEDWYIDNVTLNADAVGVVRSVLGRDFQYNRFAGNHRVETPGDSQGWHRDGGSIYGPMLDALQVFYYPQETPPELGPTEIIPGSHFLFALQSRMAHYGNVRGALSTAAPAGTIFITVYHIWHRRTKSTVPGIRNLLKYWYVRTVPPTRDWIQEPGFELKSAYHHSPSFTFGREHHRTMNDAAEMLYWLWGESANYKGSDHTLPLYCA